MCRVCGPKGVGGRPHTARHADGTERWVLGEKRNINQRIRVFLPDDHTMFHEGLAGMIAHANFSELRTREVRRNPLPRTLVNEGNKKGRGPVL